MAGEGVRLRLFASQRPVADVEAVEMSGEGEDGRALVQAKAVVTFDAVIAVDPALLAPFTDRTRYGTAALHALLRALPQCPFQTAACRGRAVYLVGAADGSSECEACRDVRFENFGWKRGPAADRAEVLPYAEVVWAIERAIAARTEEMRNGR